MSAMESYVRIIAQDLDKTEYGRRLLDAFRAHSPFAMMEIARMADAFQTLDMLDDIEYIRCDLKDNYGIEAEPQNLDTMPWLKMSVDDHSGVIMLLEKNFDAPHLYHASCSVVDRNSHGHKEAMRRAHENLVYGDFDNLVEVTKWLAQEFTRFSQMLSLNTSV